MAFDTTKLVSQITIKGCLPTGRFEDQELLDFAYDSLLSEMVPTILEAREDFYVRALDVAIVANIAAYPVPSRALNGVLREAKLLRGTDIVDLDRLNLEDIKSTVTGAPYGFYMVGNDVILHPTPSETIDTLRLYYFVRPSRLVTVAECARITAIVGNVCSITTPTGWTSTNTFDLVRGKAHFDLQGFDLVASSVTADAITFEADVPSTLAVGDYVSLAEETCFPQLPPEGHTALAQSAATSALEAIGDPFAGTSAAKAASLRTMFVNVLKTRVVGAPKGLGKRLL